eukprot:6938827-Pyramimonas_sp.AAC.1
MYLFADAPADVPVAGRAAVRKDGYAPHAGACVRTTLQPHPSHLHDRPRHRRLARVLCPLRLLSP